ncbi:hypothetical protein AVEN_243741-1 [Araneus ventricosus]|uniref:Uncharacterized protein n=1 Tax=Araneus ventricosus TaxID=182803 RepID=A0A4Y2A4X8_ARAVE|nr:hypothetical protein AVEN_243741-1 [Araneus ventricosus]
MDESEHEDFGSFEKETDAAEMEDIFLLESSMADFSINIFVLIDIVGCARLKSHYSYVCGIQGVYDSELHTTGLRSANLAKLKFVSVVNDQFDISESQLKAVLRNHIFEVDCRKEVFGFQRM